MSTMSAILVTVGSIPALPGIGATAGGAILTCGAAQAIGVVAVGLGQALKFAGDRNSGNAQQQQPQ